MSGTYQNWSADSPGGLNETMAAVREGLGLAQSAYVVTQAESAEFLLAHGGAVLSGHRPVGEPGRQGDPDVSPDAADQ